jgi:protein-arginine kinase activator protein McsA
MLCDNCHERAATVHITVMVAGEGQRKGDFCEVCFPPNLSEAEHQAKVHQYFFGSSPCPPDQPSA